MLLLILAP